MQNTCGLCCLLCCSCGVCGFTKTKLTLKEDEVLKEVTNNCLQSVNRTPYAQVGHVDDHVCCGMHYVNGIMPGCGCDSALVREIAEELQQRKVGRGNIAQLRNQENTMYKSLELDVRTDILMQNLSIAYPPSQETMVSMYGASPPTLPSDEAERGSGIHIQSSERLDTRQWNITNFTDRICRCCQSVNLELNDEESLITRHGPCCRSIVREPYAQMGSVEKASVCCVCASAQTDHAVISPDCGCSSGVVNEIAHELQRRKVLRGNIAQIKQQENLMIELIKLGVKLDLICAKEGVQYPPSQDALNRVFGAGTIMPPSSQQVMQEAGNPPRGPSSTTMEVIIPNGVSAGQVFRSQGPRGSFPVEAPMGSSPGQRITVQVPRDTAAQPLLGTEMSNLNYS